MIQQKGRQIPIHLQQLVGKEIEKLMKQGNIEKANNIDKNSFVSPAVSAVKRGKSVKKCPGLANVELNHHTEKGTDT